MKNVTLTSNEIEEKCIYAFSTLIIVWTSSL
jgi:hypothetical protein